MAHFRAVTIGNPVVMGRKTYLSIGKPLAGRTTIVVSRDRCLCRARRCGRTRPRRGARSPPVATPCAAALFSIIVDWRRRSLCLGLLWPRRLDNYLYRNARYDGDDAYFTPIDDEGLETKLYHKRTIATAAGNDARLLLLRSL